MGFSLKNLFLLDLKTQSVIKLALSHKCTQNRMGNKVKKGREMSLVTPAVVAGVLQVGQCNDDNFHSAPTISDATQWGPTSCSLIKKYLF